MLPSVTAPTTRPAPDDEIAVALDQVSVRYQLPRDPVVSVKEYVVRRIQRRWSYHEFWALRDVSLTLRRGEILGLIGRNGAGKTTLLKLVARIIRPTAGRVQVIGQVTPLLTIGLGFHPDLLGRENVYIAAALLGHSTRDIDDRFNQIVEFADIGEFIDLPLRMYSAGMVARLGFAVATAWQPDVLLLDEVLAVGDEAFQRRCWQRLQRIRQQGASIVLVSHDTSTVQAVCSTACWLEDGRVRHAGAAAEIASLYLHSVAAEGPAR